MLTIREVSDKRCFICGTTERTVVVQFGDKSFRGVLCLKHVWDKLREQPQETKAD
jgi:hypothetical protein